MTERAFLDPHSPPSGRELEDMLGPATELWARLLHDLSSGTPVWESWRFGGPARGWRLRVMRGAQGPALYLSPRHGHFVATFGDARSESRARVDVRTWRDVIAVEDRSAAMADADA